MKWTPFLTPVKTIDFDEANDYINANDNESFTILDVRQDREYEAGHIPGARMIPLPELKERISELDPQKPVLVYCAVGSRSRMAAQILHQSGVKTVLNLSGGINAWENEIAMGDPTQGVHLFSGAESPEEILKIAYSLEEGLRAFYAGMVEKTDDEEVKALFQTLSKVEIIHQNDIYEQFLHYTGASLTRDAFEKSVEVKTMEGGMTIEEYTDLFNTDFSSPIDIISLAMSIEAQALDLYHRVGQRLTDKDARAVIFRIEKEEKKHLEHLGSLMDSL